MGILGDTIMTALRRIPIYRIDCGDTVGLPIPTIVRLSSYHGGRKRTSISFKMMCLSGRKDELLRSSTNRIKPPRTGVLVAPQGFEPRYAAPEAAVLPLNEGAMRHDVPSYSRAGFAAVNAPYSSRSTCKGFWPRMRKLAAQPVPMARIAVPISASAVASHST